MWAFAVAAVMVSGFWNASAVRWVLLFLGAVGVALMLFVPVVRLRCPRCSRLFHYGPSYRNDFAMRCLHCGLRLRDRAFRSSST